MARIACPGCSKQYNVPDSAAGQTATCKACGKKFRLGKATTKSTAKQTTEKPTHAKIAPARQPRPTAAASQPVAIEEDSFWDEEVPQPTKPLVSKTIPGHASQPNSPSKSAKPKKKKKKRRKVQWGFDWGKVGGGLLTFLLAGGATLVLMMVTGRIYFWPAGIAIVGLFTALSGLMGEEGVW